MLVLSDVSFARVPGVAANIGEPVAVLKAADGANAMIANVPISRDARIGGRPGFVLILSVDPSGQRNPVLVIRQESGIASWKWIDTLSDMRHTEASAVAAQFSRQELGSGARVQRILRDFPSVATGDLIDALNAPAREGVEKFVAALGLPEEITQALAGELDPSEVPGATVFQPEGFGKRFQASMAYEVSGEGSRPGFWKLYRKIYLQHPRLMIGAALGQVGAGVVLTALGARRWEEKRGKVMAITGTGIILSTSFRMITAQWIRNALESTGLAEKLRQEQERLRQARETEAE